MKDEETRMVVAAEESAASSEDDPSRRGLTDAERLAAGVVAVLDRLEESMPDLRAPDPEVARRARGARTVSPEFVSSLIAMVDASPGLQAVTRFDRDKARGALQSRDPYRLIAERLTMLLATVNHTKEAQWAEVARAAMETYRMANAIAEQPANQHLIPHLKTLRRHLHRTSGPKRKKKTDPDPDPEEA